MSVMGVIVSLIVLAPICRGLDAFLEALYKRYAWRPNQRTCPTCGARTLANRLVAPAPPPLAPLPLEHRP